MNEDKVPFSLARLALKRVEERERLIEELVDACDCGCRCTHCVEFYGTGSLCLLCRARRAINENS